ncbi:pyruvate kinase [Terracoccus luteus]|jgi:pyruvate kinase|uniref:Pyruvate kinase n=1 Tax=Terracoccus luteus TaxID=53356 RepID=A0A495Y090_9MICO|nr:pyruvate kinase [Terracoccus luteus]MBB2987787.1 pyruvate kinase [Terracoccus luteus]MCP2173438.1 pyruvate kinase [Terracoccus luteus]RKT78173.1 pyruvate kinase [Terracoccus luteus]
MRRAKIVCTIGPKTSSPEQLKALVDAGMDVARLNLSHGEHSVHEQVYDGVRAASDEAGRAVGILVDLQGPKIRTARFKSGPVTLAPGQRFTITTREVDGDENEVGTTYAGLPGDVNPGDMLLIDDGKVMLRAVDVTDTDVIAETVVGGVVSNNKGINLPGVAVSVPALSEKDVDDLRFAMRLGADMIALSFVRSADDIVDVHAIMDEFGFRIPVIAKIEKPQAVANLPEIVRAFDGIMVARGDLGVEMPLEEVPLVQKTAIELARKDAKPVIVATQVLESMIENARPTRAEASDAANAVLDGADALMLSGETSVGAYPIQAVQTMARIIASTEEHGYDKIARLKTTPHTVGGAITKAAVEIGEVVDAKFLITFSETGDSAQRMSRVRPHLPMLVFTSDARTRSRLALVWGIETYLVPRMHHTDQFAMQVDLKLLPEGRVVEGDRVVIVAGSPPGIPGSTNALRVHRAGDAVNRAAPAYRPEEVTG